MGCLWAELCDSTCDQGKHIWAQLCECVVEFLLPFFFLDALHEFRFKKLHACREECPRLTTHELLCWTVFHAF